MSLGIIEMSADKVRDVSMEMEGILPFSKFWESNRPFNPSLTLDCMLFVPEPLLLSFRSAIRFIL